MGDNTMTVEYAVNFLKNIGLQSDLYFTRTGRLVDRFESDSCEEDLSIYKVSKIEIYDFFAIIYIE